MEGKHNPLLMVDVARVINTDDTTTCMFEGVEDGRCEWRLVGVRSNAVAGTHSSYRKNGNKDTMRGMRVKLTFSYAAVGCMAPIFASERESKEKTVLARVIVRSSESMPHRAKKNYLT